MVDPSASSVGESCQLIQLLIAVLRRKSYEWNSAIGFHSGRFSDVGGGDLAMLWGRFSGVVGEI